MQCLWEEPKLSILQRIKLYFSPLQISIDHSNGTDQICLITYKEVEGILVIKSIEYTNKDN